MSTHCEQRYIKRRRHWSRFVGIPQGLSPYISLRDEVHQQAQVLK
ncbi:hypothetical protein J2W59_001213 [Pseudomonas fluorescens]|nr:hypothetical protein [Pseudomonas fluorescens]